MLALNLIPLLAVLRCFVAQRCPVGAGVVGQDYGPPDNEITSFPGFSGTLPSKQYGGYINVPGTEKQLFYMFVLSTSSPATDPVVLW